MECFFLVLAWFVLAFLAWSVADNKGRWGLGYFVASIVVTPLIMLVVALCVSSQLENKELEAGRSKRCPFCDEVIRAAASVCRFCGRDLIASESGIPPAASPAPPNCRDAADQERGIIDAYSGNDTGHF